MFDFLGVIWFTVWVITALFILLVTMTLELMICYKCRSKWLRLLPVLPGAVLSAPSMYVVAAFGAKIAGISLAWPVLAVGILLSLLGCGLGILIYRRN